MLHIHVPVNMNEENCNLVWKYKDSFPKSTRTFVSESVKLIWAGSSFSTSMSLPYKPYLSCNLIGESQSFKCVSDIANTILKFGLKTFGSMLAGAMGDKHWRSF